MCAENVKQAIYRTIAMMCNKYYDFDTLRVRDLVRAEMGPSVPVLYGDVFSEIWHHFRKNGLKAYYGKK